MPRYALVELSTMAVANVALVSSVPAAPPGFRNIVESANPVYNEWTPGDDPVVGDIWDGAIPAGFAPPVVDPGDNPPTDQVEAFARIATARAALDLAISQAAALVPTTA